MSINLLSYPKDMVEEIPAATENLILKYQMLLANLDGTLVEPPPPNHTPLRNPGEDYVWLRGRVQALNILHDNGWQIAVVTNQPRIGTGRLLYEETDRAIRKVLGSLGFFIPHLVSPFDPPWSHPSKPETKLHRTMLSYFPYIPWSKVICIGDKPENYEAAQAMGLDYEDADVFFRIINAEPEELPF